VQIVIDPSGDTAPPQVWWTYPADRATDVGVSAIPVTTDDAGPVLPPLPFVQFSEAMDQGTVTDAAVQVMDGEGQALPVTVLYDGVMHRAVIYPRQTLQGEMDYTVTIAAGVKDLAGNPLGASYIWSFETGMLKRSDVVHLYGAITENGVELSWTYAGIDADYYEVWRADNAPYFTPGDVCVAPGCTEVTGTAYTDTAGCSGPGANCTYVVRLVTTDGWRSPVGARLGVFNFGLTPGE
jgi:hypothetical protein